MIVLGASDKPERYSHQAVQLLREHGHDVIPVHPSLKEIDGLAVVTSLDRIGGAVDTLSVYVNRSISEPLAPEIIRLQPKRVLFNPGSESPALETQLRESGIAVEEACTLVLLRSGSFALDSGS